MLYVTTILWWYVIWIETRKNPVDSFRPTRMTEIKALYHQKCSFPSIFMCVNIRMRCMCANLSLVICLSLTQPLYLIQSIYVFESMHTWTSFRTWYIDALQCSMKGNEKEKDWGRWRREEDEEGEEEERVRALPAFQSN